MAQDFSNYINTYKGSSVLQNQFPNMNDYLSLFGYQGSTPSSATTSTTPSTSSTSSGVQGIINQNINQYQGGGGGGGITSARGSQQRVNDFNNAIAARQESLNNPGKVQGFVNSAKQMIGIDPQMSVEQMLARSGYMNPQQRPTGGIPFGVGSAIAMAMPDKYYDMPLEDQIFTQSQMGYNDGSGYKDEFGYNTRSAFGNYGEFVEERVDKTGNALEKSADKFSNKNPGLGTVSFDKVTGEITGDQAAIDAWNKQTSYIQKEFFSFTNKAKERKAISDRVAKEKKEQDARLAKAEEARRNRAKQKAAEMGADKGTGPGGSGSRRGDADISDSARGGFATDDTAGFFARGGRVGFKKGGLATMFKLKG